MPFYRDESQLEEDEILRARVEDFEYLEPWSDERPYESRLSVPLFDPPSAAGERSARGGLFGWFRHFFGQAIDPARSGRQSSAGEQAAISFSRELRDAGIVSVYCRVDGGNDEGFAWVESARSAGGRELSADQVVELLLGRGADERLAAPDRNAFGAESRSSHELMRRQLDWTLANAWAIRLHGSGYGTGEYLMYGAFTADLVARTITDDPEAAPVVENIHIEGV